MYTTRSRSYAEDATSVTSGASQGPLSFILSRTCPVPYHQGVYLCRWHAWRYPAPVPSRIIKVCICAVGMPGAILHLSRPISSKTAGHNIQNRVFKCKIIT